MTHADPDLYEALVDAHRDLDADASARLNARLVLILMHALDPGAIRAAIADARSGLAADPGAGPE